MHETDHAFDRLNELIRDLKSEDWHRRRDAAVALGELKEPRAIEPLIETLRDEILYVYSTATEALTKMSSSAVLPLVRALHDGDSGVRKAAAQALGEIGDPRAVDSLRAALGDSSSSVCEAATKALRRLGALQDTVSAQPAAVVRQCSLCDEEVRSGEGKVVQITVGFMSAFRHLVANTVESPTSHGRRQLLGRLLKSHSPSGGMNTPTEICAACYRLFETCSAVTEPQTEIAAARVLRNERLPVVVSKNCFVCEKVIDGDEALQLSADLVREASRYWQAFATILNRRLATGDFCDELFATSLARDKNKELDESPWHLVCGGCTHWFDVPAGSAFARRVRAERKRWWQLWR